MSLKINEEHERVLQDKVNNLMRTSLSLIQNKASEVKTFYSEKTHTYLMDEKVMDHFYCPRGVYLPLSYENWPDRFQKLRYDSQQMLWPKHSTYCYAMDKNVGDILKGSFLYSGYALVGEKLIPASFFVWFEMIERIIRNEKIEIPEHIIIDPFALAHGIQPDCYIGIHVRDEFVQHWLSSQGRSKHPLELEVSYLQEKAFSEAEDNRARELEINMSQHSMLENLSSKNKELVIKWLLK